MQNEEQAETTFHDEFMSLAYGSSYKQPVYVIAGEPLAEKVGNCPECGRSVFEFHGYFACTAALTGHCGFKIDSDILGVDGMESLIGQWCM